MSEEQNERDFMFIENDEGEDEKFEVIYEFEADGGNKYIFLVPADLPEEEEEAEVYVFRFDEQGDDIQLYPIEDDNEWDMIEEVFNTLDDEIDL